MRTAADERCRRGNILWTIKERLESEARIAAMRAMEDIAKALKTPDDDEAGAFYAYFAGVQV